MSEQRSEEFRRVAVEKFQSRGLRSVEEVARVFGVSRVLHWLAVTSTLAAGLLVAVAVFVGVHTNLPFPPLPSLLAAVMLGAILLLAKLTRGPSGGLPIETLAIGGLTCAGVVAAAFTAYQMAAYISLPADILLS